MSDEQQLVFDWIDAEAKAGGVNSAAMPFKLSRFRSVREALIRAGLVVQTVDGRYIPTTARCGVS